MDKILAIINWLIANWETVGVALLALAALTPTDKDDNILKRVVGVGAKWLTPAKKAVQKFGKKEDK